MSLCFSFYNKRCTPSIYIIPFRVYLIYKNYD
uniref:Uncharacterized protein n=1 Tax=Siphoviridae sp. ctNZc11 TaxID=2827858 RepID=A0A8S5TBX8_9CAUD|nr:MAG TPA: hypothetical protein [Siphoviridae sp. ctNZc11]DAL70129.1 MAG TPA: hypothetical protein [Caudoviricetes sp.]